MNLAEEKLYKHVYRWLCEILQQYSGHGPVLIGLNGPQGSGKTTLASWLVERAVEDGRTGLAISIDDFYLSRSDQQRLADSKVDNPYLQVRGYPGTHDIQLGIEILSHLKQGQTLKIPRYDKSAFDGKGDRKPFSEWRESPPGLDFIIFEGWMLGFRPQKTSDPNLQEINRLLAAYRKWENLLDGFIHLYPMDYKYVLKWRVEAEEKMKASGLSGMSKEEVSKYIQLFLPAYELYEKALFESPPSVKWLKQIKISDNRLPSLG